MLKLLGYIAVGTLLLAPVCEGQTDEVSFRSAQIGGLRLYGISVFSGYSSSAYPLTQPGQAPPPGASNVGGDVSYGATATLGWRHVAQRESIAVMYSGTYDGMAHYSNLNALNHSLNINFSRALGHKWSLNLNASGSDTTLAQLLFVPSNLSVISQVPASLDDLGAAVSNGQFSGPQAASMLSGVAGLQAPLQSALVANRALTYNAGLNLSYAVSSRLSFHFGSFNAAGIQRLGKTDPPQPGYPNVHSIGATGGMGFSYAFSPRTQMGLDVEEIRQLSHYQSAYLSTITASASRKMGVHWFLNGTVGGTYSLMTKELYGMPKSRQMIGGGSLGYKTQRHAFVASYNRSSTDAFGIAVGTATSAQGSWTWHRTGSPWSMTSSFGEQQARSTGFISLSGWQASTGFSEALSNRITLSAQYVYLNSAGTFAGTLTNVVIHSVRLSLGWAPQGVER